MRTPSLKLPPGQPGQRLFAVDLQLTTVFTVFAIVAAAFPGALRIPFAVLACALFGIGIVAFLWAYVRSIERSRLENVSVAGIYGLSGSAPSAVRWRFHALTLLQTVVAIATAAMRPYTAQAFGILAPMLGLGLGGLWAAVHGKFDDRRPPPSRRTDLEESINE